MAELRQNTWTLDQWYDQEVAGTTGGYQWGGTLWMQGLNGGGGLGLNEAVGAKYSSPTQVPGTTWRQVVKVWGIKKDGTLWGWGSNTDGQLGQNDRTQYSSPMQIGSGTDWSLLGGNGALQVAQAVKTDGTLWVWGGYGTNYGMLGLNNINIRYSSPTQVGADTNWASISIGEYYGTSVGTKTDGTMWSWGYMGYGSGHNSRQHLSSPTQIPGTDWSTDRNACTVIAGGAAAAVKSTGTLWTWGWCADGLLGLNGPTTNAHKSSPVQVGTGTNWASVVGAADGPATRCVWAWGTDGTLFAWGQNPRGGLGQNNRTNYSSPCQIPGTTWTSSKTYGTGDYGQMWAPKTDGTMWAWGSNTYGNLGHNNTTQYSSPTQVGTDTNWYSGMQVMGDRGGGIKL